MSVIYIHNGDRCTDNTLFVWEKKRKKCYWYGSKSPSVDRLLIKVSWTVFQLHSRRKQASNNTSPIKLLHMPTCDVSIGVTARYFQRPRSVTYSIHETLIYVQSGGRDVYMYLIRPTEPGDSYFGSDFTHYIYWVLHKIFSFYYFRQCLFLFEFIFKIRK